MKIFCKRFSILIALLGSFAAFSAPEESNLHSGGYHATVIVKNNFRKRTRQILTTDKMPHAVKVCRADDPKQCTEEVTIDFEQSHTFEIHSADKTFSSIFSPNGHVLPKTLVVYASGVACDHEDDADMQYYPSTQIPYGVNHLADAQTMEVSVNRMATGTLNRLQWSKAICSIRYKDAKGETKLGMLNLPEIVGTCRNGASANAVQQGSGIYHFNGYLPPNHFLAHGLWDESFTKFAIHEISLNGHFLAEAQFCAALKDHLQDLELIGLKIEVEKNIALIASYIKDLDYYKHESNHFSASSVLFSLSSNWDDALTYQLNNFVQAHATEHGNFSEFKIPELDGKSKEVQILTLQKMLAETTLAVNDLSSRVSTAKWAQFNKNMQVLGKLLESLHDSKSSYDDSN